MNRKLIAGIAVLAVVVIIGVLYFSGFFKETYSEYMTQEVTVGRHDTRTVYLSYVPADAKNAYIRISFSSDEPVNFKIYVGDRYISGFNGNTGGNTGNIYVEPGSQIKVIIENPSWTKEANVYIKWELDYEK